MSDHVIRHVELLRYEDIIVEEGFNCRIVKKDDAHVKSLAESIRAVGLQEPLQVGVFPDTPKGKVMLVDGENRYTALGIVGVKDVLCVIDKFKSREEALFINVEKNYKKKRLRTYELALAAERLKKGGYSIKEIAAKLTLSEAYVGSLVRMCEKLIEPLMDMFRRNDSEATVADLIQCASMSPTEQAMRHHELVYGKPLEPEKESPKKVDTEPRMLNRAKTKALIHDLLNGESIDVRGAPKLLTEDMRACGVALLRHVLGESKKNPVKSLPAEDI